MCLWIPLSAPVNDGQHTWLELWATRIATVMGLVLFIDAFLTVFWSQCIASAIMQMLAALIIISIEGPTFVDFLSFALPVSQIIGLKSLWHKVALYAILTLLPFVVGLSFGCIHTAFIVGFFESLFVTGIYLYLALSPQIKGTSSGVGAGDIDVMSPAPPPYPGGNDTGAGSGGISVVTFPKPSYPYGYTTQPGANANVDHSQIAKLYWILGESLGVEAVGEHDLGRPPGARFKVSVTRSQFY
ncbi:unnamed protein product [Oppiella nova]|uniref:Uncharacterized protein n=1 Tax=Oppiella nova TaxID=334625 RepID=A0A7R9QSR4_9ACAR|nr:unnamed protein product [Oppiella nova]CAG2174062.1 unnamed protein product [Oppiella nova]